MKCPPESRLGHLRMASCSIGHERDNGANTNLNRFRQFYGTIKPTLRWKCQQQTLLKLYTRTVTSMLVDPKTGS
jgi:hypothetical protein